MGKEIVVFLSQDSMGEEALARAREEYPDAHFAFLTLSVLNIGHGEELVGDNERLAREQADAALSEDAKVLIARGYNAACLRKLYPGLKVVELPTTSYDILRTIPPGFRGEAAVITCGLHILGLDLIARRCAINIRDKTHTDYRLLPAAVEQSVRDEGVDLIIGGACTRIIAEQSGGRRRAVQIQVGPEGLWRAIREARSVIEAIREELAEQRYLGELMDTMSEGVVAVREGRIHAVNATAEKLIGAERHFLVGRPAALLPAEFTLEGEEESRVVAFRGANLFIRKISRGGDAASWTLSLNEHDTLSKMEHSVRLKIASTGARYTFKDISGMSPQISQAIALAHDYAHCDANILILGESGCGKEVFAQSIHYESARRDKPFLAVNCAGFTRELLQSELFGYVAGSFTGASRQGKAGIFETAHEGTVFLDEIAEMDFNLQASLLRVLQEHYVARLGSYNPIPVNVRLIAATNQDLEALVAAGRFREDLYYRLNVLPLEVPPLRERGRDVVQLLNLFLKRSGVARRFTVTPEAERLLLQHQWPGNVRELMNVAQRIAVTNPGGKITEAMLKGVIHPRGVRRPRATSTLAAEARVDRNLARAEAIREAVAACDGNLSEAAKRLGIARSTLWRRIKRVEEA